ncbi:MAG: 50S ribosomal protein L15 [Deltaproteobacteria bacterium]|nr:50S ribosomal protein L15 [Deltaproteobacteria bacterium]
MRINDLSPAKGSRRRKKRVGRGPGSGHGKTSCRGHKGQNARSGGGTPPGFEGGQMPLQRRLPKRGFTNIFKKEYALINIKDLQRFESNADINAQSLKNAGVIKNSKKMVKLLGMGEIKQPLKIKIHRASKIAIQKVQAAGGKVELI